MQPIQWSPIQCNSCNTTHKKQYMRCHMTHNTCHPYHQCSFMGEYRCIAIHRCMGAMNAWVYMCIIINLFISFYACMGCTAWVSLHGLHCELHWMGCTACGEMHGLHCMSCTAWVALHVLQYMGCIAWVAWIAYILHCMCCHAFVVMNTCCHAYVLSCLCQGSY